MIVFLNLYPDDRLPIFNFLSLLLQGKQDVYSGCGTKSNLLETIKCIFNDVTILVDTMKNVEYF